MNPKTHFAIVPGSGKRDASGSLVTYIHFLTHPVSRRKPFQGRKCELENVPRINCCVFLFLDNQQKQGVHMGVHQEFAGCLVRLGGDAAYRPAGGYVGGRAAAPWAGAGGAEPRAPALPARAGVPRWTGSLLPRARDVLLEIPQSKLHDHTFNIKRLINQARPQGTGPNAVIGKKL